MKSLSSVSEQGLSHKFAFDAFAQEEPNRPLADPGSHGKTAVSWVQLVRVCSQELKRQGQRQDQELDRQG